MLLRPDDTHDYEAFMDDTPSGFYWSYSFGSVVILSAAIALFTVSTSKLVVLLVGAAGLALLWALAVVLIRRYSRVREDSSGTNPL